MTLFATQVAMANVSALPPFSADDGLIQTTSGLRQHRVWLIQRSGLR